MNTSKLSRFTAATKAIAKKIATYGTHGLVCVAVAGMMVGRAQAASLYWDSNGDTAGAGDTPTGTWGIDAFWNTTAAGDVTTPTAVTTANDDLFFSAGTDAVNPYTISLNSATQNGRLITFKDGTVTLGTGTLSLTNNGGITVSSSTVSGATISSGLTLFGKQTFNVAAGRTLTLDTGTFTRNAGATLNVLSTGTITSTMTGLAAGSLVNGIIGPWASRGSGTSTRYATIDGSDNIVDFTGTTANTEGGWTSSTANYEINTTTAQTLTANRFANTLRYSGTGLSISLGTGASSLTLNGILATGASGVLTITRGTGGTGTVTNDSELVINNTQQVNINGAPISGAGGITKNGTGTVYLGANPAAAHTYLGTTTLNGGVTMFGGNLPGGNLTLNGGVFEEYWTSTFSRALGADAGKVQLIGGASGFSENGATSMNVNLGGGGTVVWGASGEGSATGFFNPSTLLLQSSASQSGSTLDFKNGINLNGATRTISVLKNSNLSSGATISGAIIGTGASGLIKEGVGHLALTASNTYAGGTTISNGTLRFNTRASMPAAGTVTVANGATLEVTVAGSGTTWGSGTGVAGIAGLTSTANSGEGYGGQSGAVVDFNGNSSLNLNVTADVTEANAIGNGTATSIRLIKSGANKLTLTGNNTYSGGTTLSAGTLAVGSSATALSSGTLYLNGGTIQSSDATARTISNAVSIGGDFTVGGTGDLTFSNTGASALGWTRQITVNTGRNATFAQAFSGSTYGITKAGAGTLTLTGANTYTGLTTLNGGKVVLNNGTVTGSGVSFSGNNTTLTIQGGSGVNSTWNLGGGDFTTLASGVNLSNIQTVIDGAGTAGSAVVTNVGNLVWGKTATTSSTILLTNGGRMNVNGEVRIGNPYYSTLGGANMTIGGGTATSTFTGNSGQAFYIGFGERENSNNNIVTVSFGGVLTSVGNMFVGDVNNQQGNDQASTANKLVVTGTGTASMVSITVGNARKDGVVGAPEKANANVAQVTSGGQLTTTSGISYIGRAALNLTEANNNTVTVTGTDSQWNASNQSVYVGYTGNAGAVSTGNVLTVSTGGVVTNINALIVKAANTLSLGTGGTIYANAVTNSGTLAVTIDGSATPSCGRLNVSGNLNLNNATINVTVGANPSAPCVIATYGSLTGGVSVTNLPANYSLDTSYKGNQIAVKFMAAGTVISFF